MVSGESLHHLEIATYGGSLVVYCFLFHVNAYSFLLSIVRFSGLTLVELIICVFPRYVELIKGSESYANNILNIFQVSES